MNTAKIDALVAEKVMKYRKHTPKCMHAAEGRTFYEDTGQTVWLHKWEDDIGPTRALWYPSTDTNDAMEVLEFFRFYAIWGESGVKKPRIRADLSSKSGHTYTAIADTAPLAICLAALRAVGVEVDANGDVVDNPKSP